MALAEIKTRKLFRDTYSSFESYCKDRFGYGRDYAYSQIGAAKVYQNLADMSANGRQLPLPTNERQLRALVKARMSAQNQMKVWTESVKEARGKIPSGRIVKEVVKKFKERVRPENPFREGDICRIVVGDRPELKGKRGCWGIVSEIDRDNCTINTWDSEYTLPHSHLKPMNCNEEERLQMEDFGVRMTNLYERGGLEGVAVALLRHLGSIDRPYLTALEEEMLGLVEGKK